jgi:anti-sigma factor RsiW
MNCSDELIGGYLDRELDLLLHIELEQHLAMCKHCSEICASLRIQKDAIRSEAPYYPASARLERAVGEALRKNAGPERGTLRQGLAWRWLAIAASVLLAASITWNAAGLRHAQRDAIAQTLIASHIRSLMGDHLLDVASTDQHTVKPWFNGRTDFSPEVQDLAPQGFPLVGGRLDYADGRTVAALIYRRRQHLINLFTWPTSSAYSKESQFARDGFNVLQWSDASMTYWVVSDLDSAELSEFRRLCGR